MPHKPVCETECCPERSERCFANLYLPARLVLLTSTCLLTPLATYAQRTETRVEPAVLESPAAETAVNIATPTMMTASAPARLTPTDFASSVNPETIPETMIDAGKPTSSEKETKQPYEQEIIAEGLVSYGNYKIFAAGTDCKLYTAGVEYDRHSWGRFLGSQFDYVAEFLPFVLLNEPAKSDQYGNPKSKDRKLVPGIGFSPIGFRWMWRPKTKIRPYLESKGGALLFSQKALSTAATYENFSLQSAMGLQVMMTPRIGLRLGLFSDFHFSNAFIKDSNPGLDVMSANLGISWHFHDH